jgi:tetratricopeptide (TPR) repeat protein
VSLVPGQVLVTSFHLYLIAGTLIAVVFSCSRGFSYERLLHWTLVAGVVMSLYGFAQAAGLDRADWSAHFEARAFSTLGNPDYLGGHLIGLLPLAFVMTLRTFGQLPWRTKSSQPAQPSQRAWVWLRMMTLVLFVGMLLARVKGSFIALVVVTLFLFLVFALPVGRELFQRNRRYVLICLGVLVIGGAAYLIRHGGFGVFGSKQVTVQQRIENYQVAREMIKDHFWAGIGLGQIGVQYAAYQTKPYPPSEVLQHPVVQSTHIHNDLLQYWVEGGLIGAFLFLLVLAIFAQAVFKLFKDPGSRKEDKELLIGVLAGLVGLLAQSMSNFPLRIAPTSVLFGLLLAAPLALRQAGSVHSKTSSSVGQRSVLALAMVAVLTLGVRWTAASIAMRNTRGETGLRNVQPAVTYSERLIALSPADWQAWTARGSALELAGQVEPAFEAYQKAVSLDPNSIETLSAMANLRLGQGRVPEALELCEKALAIAPNYSGSLWTKGVCLFQLKRFDESAKLFETLASVMPNDPQTFLNLGVCYINLHRKAEAIAAWQRSLQLDPTNAQAKTYLKSQGIQF